MTHATSSGFVAVPTAALDVCEDEEDEWAVWKLWRLADSRRHREMDAPNRALRALWCMSSRRTERLLARLVDAGMVTIAEPGGSRTPRRITVWRPERRRERSTERSTERSDGVLGGPIGEDRSAARSAARSADGSAYLGDQTPDLQIPDSQREDAPAGAPPFPSAAAKARRDRAKAVLAGWPSLSGRPLAAPKHVDKLLSAKKAWGLTWEQLEGIGHLLTVALAHVRGMDRAPWEWAKTLPTWAVPYASLAGSGKVSPSEALRENKVVDPSRLADAWEEWCALGQPDWPGNVYRFEPRKEAEPAKQPISRAEARRRCEAHRESLRALAASMPQPDAWLRQQVEAYADELRADPGVVEG